MRAPAQPDRHGGHYGAGGGGGSGGSQNVLTFPTVAAMAASNVAGVVDGTLAFCIAERLWFRLATAAETVIRNVNVTSTGAGRQWLQDTLPGKVFFGPPRGAGADDAADYNALAAYEASNQARQIWMIPGHGPYAWQVTGLVPTDHQLWMNNARIVSTLNPAAPTNVFLFGVTYGAVTQTTAVAKTDRYQVQVNDNAGIVDGALLWLEQGTVSYGHGQIVTVDGAPTGAAGAWLVTIKEPLLVDYPNPSRVTVVTTRTERAEIHGPGSISGTAGDRLVMFTGAKDCRIFDMDIDDTDGHAVFSVAFNQGAENCAAERVRVRYPNSVGSWGAYLAEGCVSCDLVDPELYAPGATTGILWELPLGNRIDRGQITVADNALNLRAPKYCELRGGTYSSNNGNGATVQADAIIKLLGAKVLGAHKVNCSGLVVTPSAAPTVLQAFVHAEMCHLEGGSFGAYATGPGAHLTTVDCTGVASVDATTNGDAFGVSSSVGSWQVEHVRPTAQSPLLGACFNLGAATRIVDPRKHPDSVGHDFIWNNCELKLEKLRNWTETAGKYFGQSTGAAPIFTMIDCEPTIVGGTFYGILVNSTKLLCRWTDVRWSGLNCVVFQNAPAGGVTVRMVGQVSLGNLAGWENPFSGNIYLSRGQVQLNGAAAVPVVFADLNPIDSVKLTPVTYAGTPGLFPTVAKTAGTGFAVTGVALDTSTYTYEIS